MLGSRTFQTAVKQGLKFDASRTSAALVSKASLENPSSECEFSQGVSEAVKKQGTAFWRDLNKSKSGWIYTDEGRQFVQTYEVKEDTKTEATQKAFQKLGAGATKAFHAKKLTEASYLVSPEFSPAEVGKYFKGAILENYKWSRKQDVWGPDVSEEDKEEKSVVPVLLDSLDLHTAEKSSQIDFDVQSAVSTLYARDIMNQRGSDATPAWMEGEIHRLVAGHERVADVKVIKGADLLSERMNMFHAVGRAAASEPRYMSVLYKGDVTTDDVHYAIVGKGLTYDTGGLNLKPTGFMETMYFDKGGACAALGALHGVLNLGTEKNIVFAIGLAENSIDSRSYKPGDILTSRKGITVEVGNTDAEGRLVLGDTMTYTQEHYKPQKMIDLATLTGACMVALGSKTAGAFTNNDEFLGEVLEASKRVNEPTWHLPISEDHIEAIKGTFGNISNTGKGRYDGGASTAAAFLQNFVEGETPWVHLDIAGPADTKGNGATGFGTQTLLELFRS